MEILGGFKLHVFFCPLVLSFIELEVCHNNGLNISLKLY